jgi:methylmalonyl-CoA mutase, N-terminal domain
VACIESGWMQKQIQDEAYRAEQAIAGGEKVVVGVNKYTETEEEQPPLIFRPNQAASDEQRTRIAAHKRSRDAAVVTRTLGELRAAAQSDAGLMPPILEAVRAEATLGEICGTLRDVFGEYQPPTSI